MTQSNIKILLVLATIAILGGTYMYVFKPNMEDKKALESQIESLEKEYADLKAQDAHREEYLAEIETNKAAFEEVVEYFPATLDQEISVMFIKGVEKDKGNLQFDVNTVGLGKPSAFYTLAAVEDVDGDGTAQYNCYKASFPISYEGSYEGLKDFVDYIMNYKYRMNISSLNISYNSQDEKYSGSIALNAYCVSGEGREADKVSINMEHGVDNIFHGGSGAATVNTSSHDQDNGATIASQHDILIALNNANNDATDGIILSSGGSDTYVTSADNSVVDAKIEIAEEDGKNMVTYSIGSESYTMELASDELTVYVDSNDRVDSNDKNGIELDVSNSTDVSVYIKVEGDDTTSPRFKLGSKIGVVKIY